jgi:hypothetical protein
MHNVCQAGQVSFTVNEHLAVSASSNPAAICAQLNSGLARKHKKIVTALGRNTATQLWKQHPNRIFGHLDSLNFVID